MKNRRKINQFYIGLLIITILSIYIINKSVLHSGVLGLLIGKFSLYSILTVIPAFIGGLMFFYNKNSIISKILVVLGMILLIVSMIICIVITWGKFMLFQYILFIILGIIGIFFIVISFIERERENVK